MTLKETFKNIADAIREKTDSAEKIKPINMADKILSISGGGEEPVEPEITYTGSYDIEGLKALGYDDETIAWYNSNVDWNEEDNYLYKVTDEDKEFIGLSSSQINKLMATKNIHFYPDNTEINTFYNMRTLITIPKSNRFSTLSSLSSMFSNCYSLRTIPQLNTQRRN